MGSTGRMGSYGVDHGLDLWDHVAEYQVGGRLDYRVVVFDDEDDAGFVVRVVYGVRLVVVHPISAEQFLDADNVPQRNGPVVVPVLPNRPLTADRVVPPFQPRALIDMRDDEAAWV